MLKKYTIDLAEAPGDIQEDIEAVEAAEQKLLEKVDERFDGGFDDPECPKQFNEKFWELKSDKADLSDQKNRIAEFIEGTDDDPQASEWKHHEFVFHEPSTDDALYTEGRSSALAKAAEEQGEKIDGRVFGVSELLNRCVVDKPDGAPDNLSSMPHRVGEWLLDRLNEESMSGVDVDLGNSSPQKALEEYRKSQQ